MKCSRPMLALLSFCVLLALILIPAAQKEPRRMALSLAMPSHGWMPTGQSRWACQFGSDWGLTRWSGRQVEWDEPPDVVPPVDTPGQVYQVWGLQVGPLVIDRCRRVPPQPGEIVE